MSDLDPARAYTFDEIAARGEPRFFPADPLYYKRLAVAHAQTLMGRTLYEGQVETYMIEVMAYLLQVRGAELQFASVQRLLPFASGDFLDALAGRLGTYRLKASHPVMPVRFILAAPRPATTVIPAGTRVRADGYATLFLTLSDLLIQPAASSAIVSARAETSGLSANGIVQGTALAILDPVAGVARAEAATMSDGGAAEEDDERLRRRAAQAWETISRGGPREGYRQLALAAHPAILDVAVVRPQPCDIRLYPLTETMPPPQHVMDAVLAAADPTKGRPEGDEVFVLAAEAVEIDATLTIWIDDDSATVAAQAEAMVRGVFAAWRRALGVRLATAAIVAPVKQIAGIVEATVEGFGYRDLADHQYVELASLAVVVEHA